MNDPLNRGLDDLRLPGGPHEAPDNPCVARRGREPDGEHGRDRARPRDGDHDEGDEQQREGERDLRHTAHDGVEHPAAEPGDEPEQHPRENGRAPG